MDYLIERLQQQGLYRLVFIAAYGDWPHPCYFCSKEVDGHTVPYDQSAAVVHHLDDTGSSKTPNHDSANLVPAHQGCHTTHHKMEYWKDPEKRVKQGNLSRGRKPNAEARRKMSESQKKRFERDGPYIPTAIDRAKISAAQMGHTVSAESRTKIGAKNKGRKHTPEELAKMSAAKKGKPFSVTHRKAIAAARRGKPSGMLGKNHSPETIEKMRAASVKRARASCIRCHREMTVNNLVIHFRTHEHADMKLKAEEERP